jgi:hypothetical protein
LDPESAYDYDFGSPGGTDMQDSDPLNWKQIRKNAAHWILTFYSTGTATKSAYFIFDFTGAKWISKGFFCKLVIIKNTVYTT